MQWRLDAARPIQALIFLLCQARSIQALIFLLRQARSIQALFSKFLSNFEPYPTFKFHRWFLEAKVQLQIPLTACKPSSNLFFFSLVRYLTLGRVSRLQITNGSSEEEPRHFLTYHCITEYNQGIIEYTQQSIIPWFNVIYVL